MFSFPFSRRHCRLFAKENGLKFINKSTSVVIGLTSIPSLQRMRGSFWNRWSPTPEPFQRRTAINCLADRSSVFQAMVDIEQTINGITPHFQL
jgi:hypothetical protein